MATPSPLFNCRQATLLIERRADNALPLLTRARLWAHLCLCPHCRRYTLQSPLIARQAKAAAEARVLADLALPAAARAHWQRVLASRSAATDS